MKPGEPNTAIPVPEAVYSDAAGSAATSATEAPSLRPSARRSLCSKQLFGVANEVLIEHAGSTYRLRITQANKLILTK